MVPNKIDFSKVIAELQHLPPDNMVVLSTICLIFVVYAGGLVFARRADNRDKMKAGFFFLKIVNFALNIYSCIGSIYSTCDFSRFQHNF